MRRDLASLLIFCHGRTDKDYFMSFTVISTSIASSANGSGDHYANAALTAPSGKFVVSGSWWYDNLNGANADVRPNMDRHAGFTRGANFLPGQYEVSVKADEPGTLYVYAICEDF